MTSQSIYNAVSHVSALSVLIPLGFCLNDIRTLNKLLRVLFLYILVSMFAEIGGLILSQNKIHNYLLQHIFTIIECGLIAWIYLFQFVNKWHKTIVYVVFCIFLLTSIVILIFKGGYNRGDSILSTFESCFIMTLSGIYILKNLREITLSKLSDSYFSWLNAGFLIYFSTSFFLFLFNDYIESCELTIAYILYSLHLISNIAYNILLGIGVWKAKQT